MSGIIPHAACFGNTGHGVRGRGGRERRSHAICSVGSHGLGDCGQEEHWVWGHFWVEGGWWEDMKEVGA